MQASERGRSQENFRRWCHRHQGASEKGVRRKCTTPPQLLNFRRETKLVIFRVLV